MNNGGTMAANVGSIDRVIRIAVGLAVISLVRFGPQTAWGYLGFVPLLTGAFGWCPAYALLRISTTPKNPRPA
jgi:hypothetical protein